MVAFASLIDMAETRMSDFTKQLEPHNFNAAIINETTLLKKQAGE